MTKTDKWLLIITGSLLTLGFIGVVLNSVVIVTIACAPLVVGLVFLAIGGWIALLCGM